MNAGDISEQQARILRYVIASLIEEHRIPSVREIGNEVGLRSKNSRRHPPCDHPRREPAKVVPGFSCPDCGAVFQVRK